MKESEHRILLNIDGIIGKLRTRLQHLSDILKLSNAAMDCVDEQHYNNLGDAFVQFNIAHGQELSYGQAKNEFHKWCLQNIFRDSVEFISIFLEDCYLACALINAKEKDKIKAEDYNQIISEKKSQFHRKNFPEKIRFLRENYSLSSSLEEHVLSLNKARNCLVYRSGIIGQQDLNTSDELVVKFREIKFIILTPDRKEERPASKNEVMHEGEHLVSRNQDSTKRFELGQKINFGSSDHFKMVLTFYVFGAEIYESIKKFVPSCH